MSVLTPNMSLIQSSIGVDTGLSWEQNLNASLNVLDGHTHAPGSGLQITPSAININASLAFNQNALLIAAYLNMAAQGGSVPTPIDLSVYVVGNELFYKDGVGNAVQLTAAGSVNATSSGISSGTATASFVSSVLVVTQSVGVGAAIDAASYILRYNGSYPSPSGNAIVLSAPAALSGSYQITFPAAVPGASNALYTMSIAGVISYTNVDNSTLTITGSVMQVPTHGITATQIADNTITATQIANNTITGTQVANASLGNDQLNILIQHKSASSGTQLFTTSGAITNLSVPITVLGGPVIIMLQPDGTGNAKLVTAPQSSNDQPKGGQLIIKRDSTVIGGISLPVNPNGTNSDTVNGNGAFTILDHVASAGAHTYSAEIVLSGVTNNATIINMQLVVYEI